MDQLLNEREKTHGDFQSVASMAQRLKYIQRSAPNWSELSFVQQEALDMWASKTARILCGDPNEPDHWEDVAGYARLSVRALSISKSK